MTIVILFVIDETVAVAASEEVDELANIVRRRMASVVLLLLFPTANASTNKWRWRLKRRIINDVRQEVSMGVTIWDLWRSTTTRVASHLFTGGFAGIGVGWYISASHR